MFNGADALHSPRCMARKVNLAKARASLDTVCPKCGGLISPVQIRRVDFDHIECPACGEQFAPGRQTSAALYNRSASSVPEPPEQVTVPEHGQHTEQHFFQFFEDGREFAE
jgi:predicted RNA-binding Zn-ribbon protein involved in translation (DUF1610 family)